MAQELEKVKDAFTLMDEKDEIQIITSEDVQKSLVYKVGDKQTLSFTGITFLFQKYNQQEKRSIIIIESETYCRLEKDDESNTSMWFWRAKVKLRSTKTLEDGTLITIEEEGLSECEYGKKFARIMAHSKAERNAQRKLIPEFEITNMITKFLKAGQVENIKSQDTTSDAPTEKQLSYLKSLGHTGRKPDTKDIASRMIEDLKKDAKVAETKESTDVCICDDSMPGSVDPNYCQNCKKLLEQKS